MLVGAVDVHYDDAGGARSALVVCRDRTFDAIDSEHVATLAQVAGCVPGALFERELPCIQAVLAAGPPLGLLVVDGYATLDPDGRPGLGAHAAEAFDLPVIGVAKTRFRAATHAVEVVRGGATRPLYVTVSGGVDVDDAAQIVAGMAGPHRIPAALGRADRLARGLDRPMDPSR